MNIKLSVKEISKREQQVSRLIEICEDLDTEGLGYVSTNLLAKILRGVPGARSEIKSYEPGESARAKGVQSALEVNKNSFPGY